MKRAFIGGALVAFAVGLTGCGSSIDSICEKCASVWDDVEEIGECKEFLGNVKDLLGKINCGGKFEPILSCANREMGPTCDTDALNDDDLCEKEIDAMADCMEANCQDNELTCLAVVFMLLDIFDFEFNP